jgi:hypothetical protein
LPKGVRAERAEYRKRVTDYYDLWDRSQRIAQVDRIVADIGVEVGPGLVADRVGLQEPAERRVIDAGLVIIERASRRCAELA